MKELAKFLGQCSEIEELRYGKNFRYNGKRILSGEMNSSTRSSFTFFSFKSTYVFSAFQNQ